MAVSNVLPASGSTLAYAESFSFEVTAGYANLLVRVTVAGGGIEAAYDDGVAAGYQVVVEDLGATHRLTVTRDSGWSIDPLTVYVTEDLVTTTDWTYVVFPTQEYPEGMQPYNDVATGAVSGLVTSWEGRIGNVFAQADDYPASEITNDSGVAGAYVDGALDQLNSDISGLTADLATKKEAELSGTGAPGVATGNGYPVGQIYVDLVDDKSYVLVDATAGANIWDMGILEADIDHTAIQNIGIHSHAQLDEFWHDHGSAGTDYGGNVTDNGDGTVAISEWVGWLRDTADDTGNLVRYTVAADASVALNDNQANFIYVEYNGGTPQFLVSTTEQYTDRRYTRIGFVYREGTVLHITDIQWHVEDAAKMAQLKSSLIFGEERESGSNTGEVGTRNIAVTEGKWWFGHNRFTLPAIDTSAAGTFSYYYRDGVGGWTEVASQTQINNTQYDDGSGTLATLGNNRYGVHWVYVSADGEYSVVYGRGSYLLVGAEATTPTVYPDLPPVLHPYHSTLIARIIIQKSASTFADIGSPFDTTFNTTAVGAHGDLSGLANDDHTQYHTDARGDARYSASTGSGDPLAWTGNGKQVGHIYVDTTSDASWVLVDATVAANVWEPVTGVSDHGELTGLTDDDHVRYVDKDGTRAQDALYLTERVAPVNTPAPGTVELWADSGAGVPMYTLGNGTDRVIVGSEDTSTTVNKIVTWKDTDGSRIGESTANFSLASNAELRVPEAIRLGETALAPSTAAGFGYLWVKNDAPTRPMFTDDDANDLYVMTSDAAGVGFVSDVLQVPGSVTLTGVDSDLTVREHTSAPGTPAAGYVNVYAKADGQMYSKDDAGVETALGNPDLTNYVQNSAGSTDKAIARFNGTGGKAIENSYVTVGDTGALSIFDTGGNAMVNIEERAATPGGAAGWGRIWVKNDAPCAPMFTDDSGYDVYLGSKTIILNGYHQMNGTTNQWYTWASDGPYDESLWNVAGGGTSSTINLSTGSVFQNQGLYFPRKVKLISIEMTGWSYATTALNAEMQFVGMALVDGATTAGTATKHASWARNFAGSAKRFLNTPAWTIIDSTIPADTMLYGFCRRTDATANNDIKTTINIKYQEYL